MVGFVGKCKRSPIGITHHRKRPYAKLFLELGAIGRASRKGGSTKKSHRQPANTSLYQLTNDNSSKRTFC
jgi:hypothetical protein